MLATVEGNEERRLRAVRHLKILDTPSSAGFERLCELARDMFDVPIVFVALMDSDRLWVKSSCGLTQTTFPRDQTFCKHTILETKPLVVPDLRNDSRFASDPAVTGAAHVRFYAGAPLAIRPGVNVGTFCLVDREPRDFSEADVRQLCRLASLAVDELRLHRLVGRLEAEVARQRRTAAKLKRQSAELWRRQTVFSQTERMAHIGGWEYDIDTRKLFWSDEVYRIFGVDPKKEVTLETAMSFFPEHARHMLDQAMNTAIETRGSYELQLPYTTSDGVSRWMETIGQVEVPGERPTKIFGVCQDVTERKTAESRMWHLANHDPLTDLPNRALFQDRLQQALLHARRQDTKIALLMIDLDAFKIVNDTLGHDAGDAVLREQARRLVDGLRASDTVARLGGDEFAVLLTGIVTREITQLVERISFKLNAPVTFEGRRIVCHASIGVALHPDHGDDAAALMKSADLALYAAKKNGRARHEVFAPSIRSSAEQRNGVAWQARSALDEDRVEPFYQPVVRLDSGEVSGFEALLRWRHPTIGPQPPAAILSAFDDPDLAIALGDRMMARIVADMSGLRDAAVAFGRIGWNVSEAEFRRGDLEERVLQPLADAGVEPSRFVLEVTENVLLTSNIATARGVLMSFRQAGVAIALDDFGTGYASLSHLKQLPVDMIKIDQSFVRDVTVSKDSAAIVEAVVGLGRSLGIEVIAEGIESSDHLRFLRQRHCARGQGFLLQRPMPASDLRGFLREWPLRWAKIVRSYARVA